MKHVRNNTSARITKFSSSVQGLGGGFPPAGVVCVHPQGPYKLREGNWNAHVGGVHTILNISSVGITGNLQGTLFTGNTTHLGNSSTIALCTVLHPIISGIFDTQTGRISFTSHRTIPTFVAVIQNYVGYLSQRVVGVDVVEYTVDGIGITIKPVFGQGFGWDASMSCLVVGPCSGGSR